MKNEIMKLQQKGEEMYNRRQATGKKEGEKGRRSDGETKRLARPAKPAGPQDNHTTNPVVNKSIY